jgi:para-aminobenzoate synthetase component 1
MKDFDERKTQNSNQIFNKITIRQRISENSYIEKSKMLAHIHQGMYMRQILHGILCRKCEYRPIGKISETKRNFATSICGFKNNKHFLLSASLERYLKKKGNVYFTTY